MSAINIQYLGFYAVGDKFCITVPNVHNICDKFVSDVVLTLTIPPGVVLDDYTVPKGSVDTGTGIWTVGGLTPGQKAEAEFCFEITDDCVQPYDFIFTVTAPAECGDCFNQPIYCVQWHGISCCQLATCLGETEENLNIYNSNGIVTDPIRIVSMGGNSLFWNDANIFTVNGSSGDDMRFVDGSSFQVDMRSAVSPIRLLAGGNLEFETAVSALFDSLSQDYRLVTAPTVNDTLANFIVRNSGDGRLYLRGADSFKDISTISHGDYLDDAAAAGGGVPVGGHYYNTTNSVMHTRMS